jgi:hypothetical protein
MEIVVGLFLRLSNARHNFSLRQWNVSFFFVTAMRERVRGRREGNTHPPPVVQKTTFLSAFRMKLVIYLTVEPKTSQQLRQQKETNTREIALRRLSAGAHIKKLLE